MFNVGGGELLVIALIALIVLGPQRLPDAARQVGRVMGDLRRISSGFQQELKVALDDEDDRPAPARRRESVPLASTVADADTGRSARAQERADQGSGKVAAVDAAADTPAVAPAVAAALDEIVTPLPGDENGATGTAVEPSPSGDDRAGLGDHRAAS